MRNCGFYNSCNVTLLSGNLKNPELDNNKSDEEDSLIIGMNWLYYQCFQNIVYAISTREDDICKYLGEDFQKENEESLRNWVDIGELMEFFRQNFKELINRPNTRDFQYLAIKEKIEIQKFMDLFDNEMKNEIEELKRIMKELFINLKKIMELKDLSTKKRKFAGFNNT